MAVEFLLITHGHYVPVFEVWDVKALDRETARVGQRGVGKNKKVQTPLGPP